MNSLGLGPNEWINNFEIPFSFHDSGLIQEGCSGVNACMGMGAVLYQRCVLQYTLCCYRVHCFTDCQIGEVGEPKSFLVEITWGEGYPDELPTINLDNFYNRHL